MSSHSGKKHPSHHKKAVDQSTNWSDWLWDEPNSRWYSGRKDPDGEFEYAYRYPAATSEETPRGLAGPSVVSSYVATTSSGTPNTYYQSKDFTYQEVPQTSHSVDALSNEFANTTLASGSVPTQASTTSYNTPSTSGYHATSTRNVTSTTPQTISSSSTSAATTGRYASYQGPTSFTPNSQLPQHTSYGGYQAAASNTTAAYSSSAASPPSSSYLVAGNQYQTETGEASSSQALPQPSSDTITKGQPDILDKSYIEHNSSYFRPGHIFKTVWLEPEGSSTSSEPSQVFTVPGSRETYGLKVHASIRRFVIVASDHGHSQCIPILTYGGRATTKRGVVADNHAIIYTGDKPPKEIRGEKKLKREPIQVEPKTPRDKLDRESRVNYAKTHTVEHNTKVCFVGRVAKSSINTLILDYDEVWENKTHLTYSQ